MGITLIIIILTVITSILAFRDPMLKSRCLFIPERVHHNREYYRYLTSGFIHADWIHLGINMYVLYLFGSVVEDNFTFLFDRPARLYYLLLYFGALVISSLPTYFKHRDTSYYASLGASGAVSAVVFTSILLGPFNGRIYLFFIPIGLPPIVFGALYLMYSMYMARRGGDQINHDAHFYGALFGLTFPLILEPRLFQYFITEVVKQF